MSFTKEIVLFADRVTPNAEGSPTPITNKIGNGLSPAIVITIGIVSILLGILMIAVYYWTRKLQNNYKERQLKQYRENNPKKSHLPYEKTGLYIPSWERFKYNSPLILSLLFFIIGISFFIGRAIISV